MSGPQTQRGNTNIGPDPRPEGTKVHPFCVGRDTEKPAQTGLVCLPGAYLVQVGNPGEDPEGHQTDREGGGARRPLILAPGSFREPWAVISHNPVLPPTLQTQLLAWLLVSLASG